MSNMSFANATARARSVAAAVSFSFGAVGMLSAPQPASAFTVVCSNCSTVFTQAMQLAQAVDTAITTAEQLVTQIQQYQNMLLQGLTLPASLVGRITADIARVQSLYQRSQALAGSIANFDQQYRQQFTDYNTYLMRVGQSPNYMQENYRQWSQHGYEAMRTAMQSAGMNVSQIESEDALLAQLVARSQNAQGRMQAIQAGNEIAAQQVQQLQKLRLLLNDQIQSQSLWYAQNIERQTIDDAMREKFRGGMVANSAGRAF